MEDKEFLEVLEKIDKLHPKNQKKLKDELKQRPDPPGEESFKNIHEAIPGEDLEK